MSLLVTILGPSAEGAGPVQAMSATAASPNLARIRIAGPFLLSGPVPKKLAIASQLLHIILACRGGIPKCPGPANLREPGVPGPRPFA